MSENLSNIKLANYSQIAGDARGSLWAYSDDTGEWLKIYQSNMIMQDITVTAAGNIIGVSQNGAISALNSVSELWELIPDSTSVSCITSGSNQEIVGFSSSMGFCKRKNLNSDWQALKQAENIGAVVSLAYRSDGRLLAVTSDGTLSETNADGSNWQSVAIDQNIISIATINGKNTLALAENNQLLQRDESSSQWRPVTTPSEKLLSISGHHLKQVADGKLGRNEAAELGFIAGLMTALRGILD